MLYSRGSTRSYDPDKYEKNVEKLTEKYKKQRKNAGDNVRQDKQAHDALKEIKRILKKEGHDFVITEKKKQKFHRAITGRGLDYKEIVEMGVEIFRGY